MFERLTIRTDICAEPENDIIYSNPNDPEGMYNILDLASLSVAGDGTEAGILLNISYRLAEYEDTGLSPAEVAELAQAKAEGRLVVLPCKRGDMVYFIGINFTKCSAYGIEYDEVCCAGCEEPCDSEKTRNVYMTQAVDTRWILRRLNDFGRIYFLTREEAEKALKGGDAE